MGKVLTLVSGDTSPAKLAPLCDSTGGTPVAKNMAAIQKSTTGGDDVGWLAVGTHRDTDTLTGPGGFSPTLAPLTLIGGGDSYSATEGSRVARQFRIHEGGAQLVLPGGSYGSGGAYQAPLKAINGSVALAAATANQAVSVAVASNFGYLTDMYLWRTDATAALSASTEVRLMDASAGTILWTMIWPAVTAAAATPFGLAPPIIIHFSNPPRTSVVNGQFFITTVGTAITWSVQMNGYYSTGV